MRGQIVAGEQAHLEARICEADWRIVEPDVSRAARSAIDASGLQEALW